MHEASLVIYKRSTDRTDDKLSKLANYREFKNESNLTLDKLFSKTIF